MGAGTHVLAHKTGWWGDLEKRSARCPGRRLSGAINAQKRHGHIISVLVGMSISKICTRSGFRNSISDLQGDWQEKRFKSKDWIRVLVDSYQTTHRESTADGLNPRAGNSFIHTVLNPNKVR